MKFSITRTGPLLAALALGCTGAAKWQASCGCAPVWGSFVQEIRVPTPQGPDSITPEAVREWLVAHANGKSYHLDDLRALGWLSDQGCARFLSRNSLRCVYWLWDRGNEHRGIEVTFTATRLGPDNIEARYIVDRE